MVKRALPACLMCRVSSVRGQRAEADMSQTAPGAKKWSGRRGGRGSYLVYVGKEDLDRRSRKRGRTKGGGKTKVLSRGEC